jgi:hypothetical protein
MILDEQTIQNNAEQFAALVENPAYQAVRAHFESMRGMRAGAPLTTEEMSREYVKETAILSVFRLFESYKEIPDVNEIDSLDLEPENLEDGEAVASLLQPE